jgi:hypothetical protein
MYGRGQTGFGEEGRDGNIFCDRIKQMFHPLRVREQ